MFSCLLEVFSRGAVGHCDAAGPCGSCSRDAGEVGFVSLCEGRGGRGEVDVGVVCLRLVEECGEEGVGEFCALACAGCCGGEVFDFPSFAGGVDANAGGLGGLGISDGGPS